MLNKLLGSFVSLPMLSLLFGGCLAFMTNSNPAQAEIHHHRVLLARYQSHLPLMLLNQQVLPQIEVKPVVDKYNHIHDTSEILKVSQLNPNFERYFVYVESNSPLILEQVRQTENSAYFRQYNGRTVIQSGVFNNPANAQQRVQELASRGVYGANISSFSNTQETVFPAGVNNNNNTTQEIGKNYQVARRDFYYVVIPVKRQDLVNVATRIRQNIDPSIGVYRRNQPRGLHIAVGPFTQRPEVEQWNKYLQRLGYSNARVYYGQ